MRVHITKLNNKVGAAAIAQEGVAKIARAMGYRELSIFWYHLQPDFIKEIRHRLDGIVASLYYGDVVIFQYPSWIGANFDECFVNKVKAYENTRLIIFVQDVQYLMFHGDEAVKACEIAALNRADLLILPSEAMYRALQNAGLQEKPVIYQTVWDMPSDICFEQHACLRRLIFTGTYERFPFLRQWHGRTPIVHYDSASPRPTDASYERRESCGQEQLMKDLAEGGFGLVWSDDDYFDRYYSKNQPYKLGTNLAAGIPVIVRRGCAHEEFVRSHGIGFAVDSLEEADELVQNISEEDYRRLYANVRRIQMLILNGAYTRQTLQDAVRRVLEDACEPVPEPKGEVHITVKSNDWTLKYVLEHQCSVARLGDGEFDIMGGHSIPYQEYCRGQHDPFRRGE